MFSDNFSEIETPDDELESEDVLLRNKCRQLSDEEFFSIKPVWSIDADNMQFWFVHPSFTENMFVECNLDKLISTNDNLSNLKFTRKFNRAWFEDERFCRTLINRWQKGLGVDPPEVHFRKSFSSIGDGRHRTILAKELGADRIIIRIRKCDLQIAVEMLDAIPISDVKNVNARV